MIVTTKLRASDAAPGRNTMSAADVTDRARDRDLRLRGPAGVVLVASEDVSLLAVDLPAMPANQRRDSVGFAVEDRIAQSLDEVQVVLGPQVSPGRWLVAVISRDALAAVATEKAELALWPDVLLVPVPQFGWAVWAGTTRALVRLPDSTGFAAPLGSLRAFWAAAGSPDIILYGSALELPVTARAELPLAPNPNLFGFNLRAGKGGSGNQTYFPAGARSFLVVVLFAALAHLGIVVADVFALSELASKKEAELRATLSTPMDADLDEALSEALSLRQPPDEGRSLLGLMAQVFSAIGVHAGQLSVQSLRYTAAEDEAVLTVEAPDLATLQLVQSTLAGSGLQVTAGAATSRDGAAEVQMTIRGGSS